MPRNRQRSQHWLLTAPTGAAGESDSDDTGALARCDACHAVTADWREVLLPGLDGPRRACAACLAPFLPGRT